MARKHRRKIFTKPVGELKDRVIFINRVTKVVAGGKRLNFTALVVVGDEQGHVGFGKGKAREVPMAIQKAIKRAQKNLIEVPLVGTTIPYEVIGRHDAGMVVLKPASRGTGVIAGGPVRAVLELAGVRDVLTKSMRSNNPFAVVRATFEGLMSLYAPEEIAALRKKKLSEFYKPPEYAHSELEEEAEKEQTPAEQIVAVIRPDEQIEEGGSVPADSEEQSSIATQPEQEPEENLKETPDQVETTKESQPEPTESLTENQKHATKGTDAGDEGSVESSYGPNPQNKYSDAQKRKGDANE